MRRVVTAITFFFLAAGCRSASAVRVETAAPMRVATLPPGVAIDHVILAIDSLERGIALLRDATGVTAVFGGAHPGRGTQNALISLGDGAYLELLAPNPDDAAGPQMVTMFARARTLTPTGWALTARNADSVRALTVRAGLAGGNIAAGSRARPDGSMLRWRTFNPWGTTLQLLPFFIEWHETSVHPSREAPTGCTLTAMTLYSTAADSLRNLLRRAGVSVNVAASERDAMSVTMDCPRGRVTFR